MDDSSTTVINYHVIGTSHLRCNSYKEVSALIRQKQPDGVVIELDPERLLRLTLDDATTRMTAMTNTSADVEDVIGNRWFGGDFLSAIETSKELDIPIFLGDEYPIETRRRFTDTLFDVDSYSPEKLIMATTSLFRPNSHSKMLPVNVFGTFLEDPQKLLPIAATLSLPILAVVFTMVLDVTGTKASSNYDSLATFLSLVVSFVASCKVYNNLIVDRDIVLASNVQRAATTMTLLKSNQLIRKRWTFSANKSEYEDTSEHISDQPGKPLSTAIPLFTLKNPLEQNAVRNLNLFEPRWLKMIDRLLLSKTRQQSSMDGNVDGAVPTSLDNERRIIGCVTCTNKFYSAINVAKASKNNDPSLFIEGRYADVIFHRRGRFGELTNVIEGSRPSGARKVGAKILGKEAFDLSSSRDENGNDLISVVQEGYLTASGLRSINEDEDTNDINVEDTPDEINIVVVVGLLHANGVLDRLLKTHENKNNEQIR
jgi:pheromone shutdown protein TraB